MANKMTKTEIKQNVQRELLLGMQLAFCSISESNSGSYIEDDNEREAAFTEMDKQFARIEKMFGYVPSSWQRGC